MSQDLKKTELIERPRQAGQLIDPSAAASTAAEIQAAITVALRFPRDEDDAYGKLIKACERPRFQECAIYKYPRGDKQVRGPSVNLAREFARVWKNIWHGFFVVHEDDERCKVRGWAHDLESNEKITQDSDFKLLIYRKGKKGKPGGWIKPDEREKRELVNKHGAICQRNCLLQVLPRDMVDDAMDYIEKCIREKIKDDIGEHRKTILRSFASLNISKSDLEKYLGHPLAEITEDQIIDLRQIFASIRDGNTRWSEYVAKTDGDKTTVRDDQGKSVPPGKKQMTVEDLMNGTPSTEEPPHRKEEPQAPPASPESKDDASSPDEPSAPAGDAEAANVAAETVPEEEPPPVSRLDHFLLAIEEADHIKKCREIVSAASEDQGLADEDFNVIRDAAMKREEGLERRMNERG